MSSNDISKKINRLKSIARFGKHQFMNMGEDAVIEIFGTGKNAVSFIAVGNVRELEINSQYLYNSEKDVVANYTLKTFQEKLSELLKSLHDEERDCKKEDWRLFVKNLLSKPDENAKILTPIYGITMTEKSVKFGDFTIYQPGTAEKYLKSEFPKTSILIDQHFKFKDDYMISVAVKAKDLNKCNDLANKAFTSFENVANFITATFHKTNRISIFNYASSKKFTTYLTVQNRIIKSSKTVDHFLKVPIDNPIYQEKQNNNDKLWQLITAPKNELENKIMASIEWCGKALVDTDDSKALLQYIISIESLLQYDEGKFIAPSIVSQLCDMIAFLLGDSYKSRIDYSNYVRDLYKIRSSITHSGKGNITGLSLHTAHVLCYKIIRKLINEEPYKNFKTKKSLCDYLLSLKFGTPEKQE